MLDEASTRVSFEDLGRIIGRRWRDLSLAARKCYDDEAKIDEERYRKEMDILDKRRRTRLKTLAKSNVTEVTLHDN